jgi:hypothetical protein
MTTWSFSVKKKRAIERVFEAIRESFKHPNHPATPKQKIGFSLKEKERGRFSLLWKNK